MEMRMRPRRGARPWNGARRADRPRPCRRGDWRRLHRLSRTNPAVFQGFGRRLAAT